MRKKRIAIILPSLKFGGAEKVSLNLADELSKLGCEIHFVLMSYEGDFLAETLAKYKVINLKCNRTYKLPYLLYKYSIYNKPDTLISNFWKLNLCSSVVKIFNKKLKLLLWEHTLPSLEKTSPNWLYKLTSTLFYRFADKIVAVSEGVREDILRLTYGLDDKIITIYNPIAQPKQSFIGRKIKNNIHQIISVGRLTDQKNFKLLLHAFANVINSKRFIARLLIVGEGELKDELIALSRELNLSEHVVFYGFSKNVHELMNSSDLLVVSSNYEGFGNVMVEALYCGLSIVSTDCLSGPREILCDGEFGRLVPINDPEAMSEAIILELNNPRNKDKQINRAQSFKPSTIAQNFLSLM